MLPPTDLKPDMLVAQPVAVAASLKDPLMSSPSLVSDALFSLNFQSLSAFEAVNQQFKGYGVEFEGAIALFPSNPRFINQPSHKVIMPTAATNRLWLNLSPLVTRICLSGRSTQPILLESINAAGDVIAVENGVMCPLPAPLRHDTGRLPSQVFKLDAAQAKRLRLSAKAPFTLERVAV